MSYLTFPRFHAIDGNGNPIRGALLYTYEEGTNTPKVTYTDYALSVPHTNPVVLDANGEALIYLKGAYNMNLLRSDSAQVPGWPIDNIRGSGGCCSALETFTNGDLVAGVLTIDHGFEAAYLTVTVYDEAHRIIIPEYVDCSSESQILIGFGDLTLSGTWRVRYGL